MVEALGFPVELIKRLAECLSSDQASGVVITMRHLELTLIATTQT
jgi:hypothetical protein